MPVNWIDLLDPTEEELRENAPCKLEETAIELLLAPPQHDDDPRPTLQGHGDYIFGVMLLPIEIPEEDELYYQEVEMVVTGKAILTVRKTPPGGREPYDLSDVKHACKDGDSPGIIAYRIVDDVAERYLDLVDDIDAEIDELEDKVEDQPAAMTRERISVLRHDLLHIRRTLAPMRDAVRRVVDDVVEVEHGPAVLTRHDDVVEVEHGPAVFTRDVEVAFNTAYDKFLRAFDGLEFSRDLLASVRDYHQSKIGNDQNEVMKRLTVIASLILLPTFIVGVYGQNFVHMPELNWHYGYAYSWGLIVVTTIIQLVWFRRKNWL